MEFRVVAEQISTKGPSARILGEHNISYIKWLGNAEEEGSGEKQELVRLAYRFKFEKQFKKPCKEWLDMIETMCNEILGIYTKKEDQLMTATFGTRLKRRLNRVMDALKFKYPDYERLDKGAEG